MYSRHTRTMPTCLCMASGGAASQDISKDIGVPPGIVQAQQKPSQSTLLAKTASSHMGTSSEGTMSSNQSELTSPSASLPPDYMPYYMRDQLAARAAGLGSQGQPSDTPRAESQQSTQTTPAKSVQGYAPVQVMPERSQQPAIKQKGLPTQGISSGQVQGLPSMPQPAHSLQMQQTSQSLGARTVLVTPLAPSARPSRARQALPSNPAEQQSSPSGQPAPQVQPMPDGQSGCAPALRQARPQQLPTHSALPQRLLSVAELEGKNLAQQGRDSAALSSASAGSTAARGKPPPGFLPVSWGKGSPPQDGQASGPGASQPAASQLRASQAETGIAPVPEQVPRARQHQEAHQVRRQRL